MDAPESPTPLVGAPPATRPLQRYFIDGGQFSTLEEFAGHFSARVLQDYRWNGNLDAFNDILRGGFGTPEEGFCLIWENSKKSRASLGYDETARQLELRLEHCHPTSRDAVALQLAAARCRQGPTVFDWLVEIIQDHGVGGQQNEDRVSLELR